MLYYEISSRNDLYSPFGIETATYPFKGDEGNGVGMTSTARSGLKLMRVILKVLTAPAVGRNGLYSATSPPTPIAGGRRLLASCQPASRLSSGTIHNAFVMPVILICHDLLIQPPGSACSAVLPFAYVARRQQNSGQRLLPPGQTLAAR